MTIVKKVGLIIALAGVGMLTGGAAAVYYSWQQATQLPAWYSDQPPVVPSATADLEAAQARIIQQITITEGNQVEAELTSDDIHQLVTGAIAQNPNSRAFLAQSRGFNTVIEEGQFKSGMVVNLADLPLQTLNPSELIWIERATALFPALQNQTLYLGIEGQPTVVNGQLQLGSGASVTIGNLRLPLSYVADRLGISPQDLERELNWQLQQRGIELTDIDMVDDRAIIRGETRSPS